MNTLEQLRSGQLHDARHLRLSCGLESFPVEIFDLADSLEILDLSGNKLSELPDELPRLHKLRVIFCSDNPFTELPEILGQCPQLSMVGFKANRIRQVSGKALPAGLRWLILTDNQIEELPAEIGNCSQLQKLMLSGNRLRELPSALANCTQLELLRIAANALTEPPAFLLSLPSLAWLAYAGNPFCHGIEQEALTNTPMADIEWHELMISHQLGEGASGVIHHAERRVGDEAQAMALKLFKGAVTSDGLPQSEMAACVKSSNHPNLIPVLGKLKSHPEQNKGLLMSLIDAEFRNLAGPPSLASCTRDVYAADTLFDVDTALRIAHGIASAASHLHDKGVMHGDLYAHNILHTTEGYALLGDFGAASFLPLDNPKLAHALQRLEVRAFGYLLEELIERCQPAEGSPAVTQTLSELKDSCLSEKADGRPLFPEVERTLAELVNSSKATQGSEKSKRESRLGL